MYILLTPEDETNLELVKIQSIHVPALLFVQLNISGWVYYCISNAMQYSNTALDTTALVMHDSNTFFYVVPLFLMALRIS